jgi:hypothetical protein
MGTLWSSTLPTRDGERRLAQKLEAIPDPSLHIWTNLDYLPGVRDIDFIIAHQEIGFLVVECKAVPLKLITRFGFNLCQIEGRTPDQGPAAQAYAALRGLDDFLRPHMSKVPYFVATACWPQIDRAAWNQRWDDPTVVGKYADSMLFREDLESGPAALKARLAYIFQNPPVRKGGAPRAIPYATLETFNGRVAPVAKVKVTQTERQKLQAIEVGVTKDLRKRFPSDGATRVLFKGYPGTGKTFRLLQIGMAHAFDGKRVLFVCFNKTLASDIRRLLGFSQPLSHSQSGIDVFDAFQLARDCFELNGLSVQTTGDPDAWGRMVVDSLSKDKDASLTHYTTVLVDEAQDMKDWHLDLIKLHTSPGTTLCMACGDGQELYAAQTSALTWMQGLTKDGTVRLEQLRRNFRNPKRQYYVAQAFYDAYPDRFAKIADAYKKVLGKKQGDLDFARDDGRTVALTFLQDDYKSGVDPQNQAEFMTAEYYRILEDAYARIEEDENASAIDLLVLVPDTDGANAQWCRAALQRLKSKKGVDFIDYTVEDNRRASPLNTQVRFSTFHSSRGLEGDRVVVFGIETLGRLAEQIKTEAKNLGFIVLSRAVFDTVIALRPAVSSAPRQLLDKILAEQSTLATQTIDVGVNS